MAQKAIINNFTKRLLDKVLAKLFDYIIAQKEDKKHEQFTNYRSMHSSFSGLD